MKPLDSLCVMYPMRALTGVFYVMLPHNAPSWASGGSGILVGTPLPSPGQPGTGLCRGRSHSIIRGYKLVAEQILEKVTLELHTYSPMLSHFPLRDRPLSQDYLWVTMILIYSLRC